MRPRSKQQQQRRRLIREVASLRGAIALLHRISHLVVSAIELEPTCYAVLTGVTAGVGLGLNRAMLFLLDDTGRRLQGIGAVGPFDEAEADQVWRTLDANELDLEALYERGLRHRDQSSRLDERVRATSLDALGETPVALALRLRDPVIGGGTDDAGGLLHLPTSIAVPLRDRHVLSGVLYADNRFTGRLVSPIHRTVFSMVAEDAGRAIANAQHYEQVKGEARTDALTGLGHHGAFMVDLTREAAAGLEASRPLGLAMIDLDRFKQVNDTLGHLAGDALLAGLASRMRGVLRGGAGLYRYGGDEFVAILPGTDRASAAMIGERLRRAVGDQPFSLGDGHRLPVTCSIGVASLPEDADAPKGLVAAADEALLRAKAGGKDRVEEAGKSS